MFAVIRTGGKQYRVAPDDVITVDKLAGERGEIVEFGEVLVLGGDNVQLGAPTVAGAAVAGEVVEQSRGAKIIAFKKRRRKNSRRKRGHRQEFTRIRITEILTEGARPTPRPKQEARPKRAEPPAPEAGATDTDEAPETSKRAPKRAARPTKKAAAKPKTAKKPARPAAKKRTPAKRATKGKKK